MHVGLIPDGHRRYADENNISNKESYLKSQNMVFELSKRLNKDREHYIQKKEKYDDIVEEVTVYALSENNLRRDNEELEVFYSALDEYFDILLKGSRIDKEEIEKLDVSFISTCTSPLPDKIKRKAKKIEDKFEGDDLSLNILLSYDGRKEITKCLEDVESPNLSSVWDNLLLDSEIDFVIRTGDNPYRECLSGFPIWQASYSEYYHIDKNFPAVSMDDMENAIKHYRKLRRKRGV